MAYEFSMRYIIYDNGFECGDRPVGYFEAPSPEEAILLWVGESGRSSADGLEAVLSPPKTLTETLSGICKPFPFQINRWPFGRPTKQQRPAAD